jgi:hypothetical protein
MRRRDFIAIVGGAAVAWPLSARAQSRSPRRIGMLEPGVSSPSDPFVNAFRDGLSGLGYKEGRDILRNSLGWRKQRAARGASCRTCRLEGRCARDR